MKINREKLIRAAELSNQPGPPQCEILDKEAKLPRRERRSTQRLYEELRGRGYEGAHDSVHRFARTSREERSGWPATDRK